MTKSNRFRIVLAFLKLFKYCLQVLIIAIILVSILSCNKPKMIIKPQSSMVIQEAPWGVEFNAFTPHVDRYPDELENVSEGRIDSLLELACELGVKWVRLSVNWSNLVDTSGNYHWQKMDQIVNGLGSKKIEIALCINGGHIRYTEAHAPVTPEEIVFWKEFAGQLIKRYKGKVSHWELWNEPNTVWFWKPRPKAEEYFALMKEFHAMMTELDPGAKIIGSSLARLDLVFADSLFQLGIGKYIDAISYHPYNEFPEAILNPVKVPVKTPVWYLESDHSIGRLIEMVDSVNPAIELWQAECGYPSRDNSSGWMGNGPWSPVIQAKWLLRRMFTDISYNASMISYFCLVDYSLNRNIDEGKGNVNSKGLLNLNTLSPKPAYKAYQNLISLLNGRLKAKMSNDYTLEIASEGSFYNIKSKNLRFVDIQNESGNKFLAYWIAWRMQDKVDNACFSVHSKTSFREPVLVNLMTGDFSKIEFIMKDGVQELLRLPLADYPFVVAEAESLKN